MLNFFVNRQSPQLPPQQDGVKHIEFDYLDTLDPERLVRHDINERVDEIYRIAAARGVDYVAVKQHLLRQVIFTILVTRQDMKTAYLWGKNFGFDDAFVDRVRIDVEQSAFFQPPVSQPTTQPAPNKPPKGKPPGRPPAAKPERQPEPATAPSASETQRILTPMEQVGAAIVAGYAANKLKAHFNSEASFGDGPRCRRYIFTKPVDVTFAKYENHVAESLSNAGLNPEGDTWFNRLPNNQFEIQVPKPMEEWQRIPLLDVLIRGAEFRAKPSTIEEVVRGIQANCSFQVNDRLQALFAADIDGNLINLDLSSGCAIVGASDSGKSNGVKTILQSLLLTCPNFQAAYFDLKDGLTLQRFDGLSSTWGSVATNADECMELMESLESEREHRGRLLKKAKVENIIEYNSLGGEVPLNWLPIFIEEVSLVKQQLGADWTEEKLSTIAQSWRCYGMPLIPVTQYPVQKLSIGPGIRMNMGAAVAFRGTEALGALAFGESSPWNKKVARLTGFGDCIVKQMGTYARAQCLYTDGTYLNKLIDALKQRPAAVRASEPKPMLDGSLDEFKLLFGEA